MATPTGVLAPPSQLWCPLGCSFRTRGLRSPAAVWRGCGVEDPEEPMKRFTDVVIGISIGSLVLSVGWLITRSGDVISTQDVWFDTILLLSAIAFAIVGATHRTPREQPDRTRVRRRRAGRHAPRRGRHPLEDHTGAPPLVAGRGPASSRSSVRCSRSAPSRSCCLCSRRARWRVDGGAGPSGSGAWGSALPRARVSSAAGQMDLGITLADVSNPLGIAGTDALLDALATIGGVSLVIVVLGGIASLIVRARGGDAEVRAQVRWLTFVGGLRDRVFPALRSRTGQRGDRQTSLGSASW